MERSDQEWIRQLKQNDAQAVQELWVWLYKNSLTLSRFKGQSDDLAHTAALEAFRRVRTRGVYQFKFACPFLSYCRVILVNEMNRLLGRQAKVPPTTEIDEELVGQRDVPQRTSPEELRARLQPCLEHLDPRELEIISLRYFEEKDPKTIAEQLDLSRKNVNVIAFRARRSLRECLEAQGYYRAEDLL